MRNLFALLLVLIPLHAAALETAESLVGAVTKKWTGDLADMKRDGVVRVLVPFSKTFYFIDNGVEKGLATELLREFETYLNTGVKKELSRTRLVLIPVPRDRLIDGLVEGMGDISVGNLTITPARLERVDFSAPFIKGVRELVITRKDKPKIEMIDDLAGMEIHVRQSSSYFESLERANQMLSERGMAPVMIKLVDERLEDEDLLEMLYTGSIDAMIMDEHKARIWLSLFDDLKLHNETPLRGGGEIGWAFRKNSPQLAQAINAFQKQTAQGTLLGNILLKRYYVNTDWIKNPKEPAYLDRLNELYNLFVEMGAKYHIDPLLLAALAFQESKFDNSARSRVGAVGIMQILPSTAADRNIRIKDVAHLRNNVEAGTKYVRFMADYYFSEGDTPDDQKILMALASYNAGPNRVASVRNRATNPNQWFQSVEWEVAKAAGSEPVRYVKNIYIYYVIFKNLLESDAIRAQLKGEQSQ